MKNSWLVLDNIKTVKTETEVKTGDKIYLNETILAGAGSGTQILLLDQSTFTIGEDSKL